MWRLYRAPLANVAIGLIYIHHLVHRGAICNKTAVRGAATPSPPYSAATAPEERNWAAHVQQKNE